MLAAFQLFRLPKLWHPCSDLGTRAEKVGAMGGGGEGNMNRQGTHLAARERNERSDTARRAPRSGRPRGKPSSSRKVAQGQVQPSWVAPCVRAGAERSHALHRRLGRAGGRAQFSLAPRPLSRAATCCRSCIAVHPAKGSDRTDNLTKPPLRSIIP
jgi:hypothetical protein